MESVPQHVCTTCGRAFTNALYLNKHVTRVHGSDLMECSICNKTFKRIDHLKRHELVHTRKRKASDISCGSKVRKLHDKEELVPATFEDSRNESSFKDSKSQLKDGLCNWCGKKTLLEPGKRYCSPCSRQGRECCTCKRPMPQRFFTMMPNQCNACHQKHMNQIGRGEGETAMEKRLQTQSFYPTKDNNEDFLNFFKDNEQPLSNFLNNQLHENNGLKWYLVIFIRLVRYTTEGDEILSDPTFRSLNATITNSGQVDQQIAEGFHKIYESFQTYQREGSGWQMVEILRMEVKIAKYAPLSGSTYIPTPKPLLKKHTIVNVKNSDDFCFVWSILAALYPAKKNPNRLCHYTPYFNTLNLTGLIFPLTLDQLPRFESQNNISVNVFGFEDGIFPLQITRGRCEKHVDLILISKAEVRHYCLVKSLSRLLGDRTNHQHQTFFCPYCLHGFSTKTLLEQHQPLCRPLGVQKTLMPENKWLKFENIKAQLRVPFVIYADFECYTAKIDQRTDKTTRFEEHRPSGFSYVVVCTNSKLSKPAVVYRGPDAVGRFLEELQKENARICKILDHVQPMVYTKEQEKAFKTATHCHICDGEIVGSKVMDHDHVSGAFRGAACNNCNLQYRFRRSTKEKKGNFFIPVILHNTRNYDGHLLCQVMGRYKRQKIGCIANNMQKYIAFSLGNFRFIDSLQFLNASLETLVDNMAKDGFSKFHQLKAHISKPSQQNLLLRKGVYPYSYVEDESKFLETSLPPKEAFYNNLTEEPISPENYEHAQSVWSEFSISNLGQYHDLYLKSDVLLLADVFENFRDICLNYYKLDPAHFYTSPGIAWSAMLKLTRVEIELFQDIDMHLFIEKGMRGGISMISNKYAKANNPNLEDYDPRLPSSYITYLDANNLYGWAMSQALPLKDFAWLTDQQIATIDFTSVSDTAETGYILECSLEYPSNLHDDHSDYPLCAERMKVTEEMLSDYSLTLKKELRMKGQPVEKLVPNLNHKTNYVIHYRNLKFCLAQGMVLTKIHRGIEFTQCSWLKPYIDFNTSKRKAATNEFEKSFFKLMNNAVFGKTIENLRKRTRIELVHNPTQVEKLVAKPSFESFKIFNQDLVGVHLKKTKLTLNRPIYVGFSVLDLSKLLMYDFHYNHIKLNYGNKAKLLFTDTDSLCYQIECKDLYKDMGSCLHLFDTSNYPPTHPLYNPQNAKVIGLMKDEVGGKVITEFVGLRPKMYSLTYSGQEKKTAKGIGKCAINKKLKHDMYKNSLFQKRVYTTDMNSIRSYDHKLYTINVKKVGLSPFDDKRYVLSNGQDTLAYGHFKISK